jgi:hypothetical protein
MTGNRTNFVEALGVADPGDPLPDGQATAFVLSGHSFGAAELLCQTSLFFNAIDFFLPAHKLLVTARCTLGKRSEGQEPEI